MTQNRVLLFAAGLMALTVLIHAFMGGSEIYAPLRDGTLHPLVASVLSVVWHVITAILALMAIALLWVARHRNRPLELMLIAMQLSFAVLFLAYGMVDLGNIIQMPQWIIFLAGPALILLAGKPGEAHSRVMGQGDSAH